MIYLDNAATTKTRDEVVEEMLKYFNILYGNPSSIYEFAGKSKKAVEESRHIIAKTIHAKDEEIYFTSGGTESDNWALRSIAKAYKKEGKHIITGKTEHAAILNTASDLEDLGFDISYIDVDEYGVIKLQRLKDTVRKDTILISVMMGNNEVGTLQPINQISKIAREKDVIFHTDAVQCYGQIPIDVKKMGIDLLSASAHKFNGPKGVGFLYIREGVKMVPMILGGGQENKMRSGTQNVPSIVGMAKAAELAHRDMAEHIKQETELRDYFIKRVLNEIPFSRLNGASGSNRLPGNANFSFQFTQAAEVLALLDSNGICASGGSACSSRSGKASHVLAAMGLPDSLAYASVRFTLSYDTKREDIDFVIDILKSIIPGLQKQSVEYNSYTNCMDCHKAKSIERNGNGYY